MLIDSIRKYVEWIREIKLRQSSWTGKRKFEDVSEIKKNHEIISQKR